MGRLLARTLLVLLALTAAVVLVAGYGRLRSSGPATYAGLTRAQARADAIATLLEISRKRQLEVSGEQLSVLQELKARDDDGQRVWKVDISYMPDDSCTRVLVRALPDGRYLGRSDYCL
jgi:hypothetical protein